MTKLIKGELYRLTHTGHIFIYMVIASLFTLGIVILFNKDRFDMDAAYYSSLFAELGSAFQPVVIGVLIPVAVSRLYSNKTGYYEVMDGTGPALAILSKLIVYSLTAVVVYIMPVVIFISIIGIANGTGEIDFPMFLLLYVVLTLRVTTASVMFTMIIKNGAAGFLCYARYQIFELVGLPMIALVFPKTQDAVAEISKWLPMVQFSVLSNVEKFESEFVMNTLVGFAAETVLWFVLAYINYKNKRFA